MTLPITTVYPTPPAVRYEPADPDDALLGSLSDAMADLHQAPTAPLPLSPDATAAEAARHGWETAGRWIEAWQVEEAANGRR